MGVEKGRDGKMDRHCEWIKRRKRFAAPGTFVLFLKVHQVVSCIFIDYDPVCVIYCKERMLNASFLNPIILGLCCQLTRIKKIERRKTRGREYREKWRKSRRREG
jgi:hypothetical protein